MNTLASRRQTLMGVAGLALAAGTSTASADTKAAHTFVLVHGAWHGGWCWRRVADILESQGHKVFAPTMTGLGERSHLLTNEINLTTHVTDIANVMKWENLSDVVLVAHSYGGIIASGVAEQLHDKISSIVFLDAFLPEDGETLLEKSSPAFVGAIKNAIATGEPGIKAPPARAFGSRWTTKAGLTQRRHLSRSVRTSRKRSTPEAVTRSQRKPSCAPQDTTAQRLMPIWRAQRLVGLGKHTS